MKKHQHSKGMDNQTIYHRSHHRTLSGARPIDVASNAASREYLLTWDPASTDRIKEDKRKAAKNAEKEETLGLMLVKQGKTVKQCYQPSPTP